MKVVILCGGKGIRAFPFSEYMPKPMMPVAGRPILTQIILSFVLQDFREFVLAAGHRKNVLDDYFEDKHFDGSNVEIVDTGDDADTGDRIFRCRHLLDQRFIATYGDGLADIPLRNLLAFHESHDGIGTMTCVPLYSQYGVVDFDDSGRIVRMREKPRMQDRWINAGFFVFEPSVFEQWEGSNLERDIVPALIERGELYAYRHDGFFKSLDSYKDQQEFDELIAGGDIPWLLDGMMPILPQHAGGCD